MPKLVDWIVPTASLITGESMTETDFAQSDRFAWLRTLAVLAIVPVIIMVGLLWRSPNFKSPEQNTETVLSYPLGGDYLQEYVGGGLIQDSTQRTHLYDAEVFQAAQHDAGRVGFSWDDQQFFPAVYPPFWYAAVSPLSNFTYATAARVWLILMTGVLVAALWIMNRFAAVPVLVLMVMCLSSPVIESLNAGQKGTLLLLILSASYVLLHHQRHFLSGLVFALIAFKPHLAIAIGLWMLVSKNWRWCAGAFSGVLVLMITCFVISPELTNEYVNVVSGFGNYVQSGGYNLHESFSLWSFWQQLVKNSVLAKVLTAITSLLVLGISLWTLRRPASQKHAPFEIDRSFAAMVVVTMITSPHLYTYDLTMLLLPIGLLTRIAVASKETASEAAEINYTQWQPTGLLMLLMFASGAITNFALSSGFQAGVVLLVTAWIMIMRPWFEATPRVS